MSTRGGELPRLAMVNWDHDWLTRRDGPQAAYRRLPRLMDELVERGYNGLRVDAFPHLVAARADGVAVDRFEVLAPSGGCQVRPRRSLLELATLARERDIRLWLTSAFLPDTRARRNFVRRPRDFVDVWLQTLDLLHGEGLSQVVAGLDFCDEFTSPRTTQGAWRGLFGRDPRNPLSRLGAWSPEAEERVQSFLIEVPRGIRALFGDVPVGVSASGSAERNLRKLDTTELDFLDSHFWLDDSLLEGALREVPLRGEALRLAHRLQGRASSLMLRMRSLQRLRDLERRLASATEFARLRRLQPAACAGYVSLAARAGDLELVGDLSLEVARVARLQGFRVITAGAQARPDCPGFWARVDWHRYVTRMILEEKPAPAPSRGED